MGTQLRDDVVLITGSTRGIGRAIADRCAAEGAGVVVTGRTQSQGEQAVAEIEAAGGRAIFVRTDVSDETQIQAAVEAAVDHFGKLTVLVNNAAPMEDVVGATRRDTSIVELDPKVWAEISGVMLGGVMWSCKYAIPRMIEAGGGSIVNISSAASMLGVPQFSCYTATKGAINALTRSIAVDYGAQGVRSNAIVVGYVLSGDITALLSADPGFDRSMRAAHLTDLGTPEDVAAAAVFLASAEAKFITGVCLPVDGGLSCRLNVPTPGQVDFDAAAAAVGS
ncbi:MAG TPA: SDR family oxidoreductase [Pseudonocardia sp.]|jgi:3-oxoacyl-[acyl-carrier protein] reductase|nr:SDR family oxidoreductase [Pseudonocardia sp.]